MNLEPKYELLLRGGHVIDPRNGVCELTLRDGKVVYDLNGLSHTDWTDRGRPSARD